MHVREENNHLVAAKSLHLQGHIDNCDLVATNNPLEVQCNYISSDHHIICFGKGYKT